MPGKGFGISKIAAKSLVDQARDSIRDAIFQGRIQPDERLTIERLAAELGSSRTPVREALRALEADGIVKMLPNRGAVVQGFSRQDIHDRYSIRALLDGYVSELACRNRGKELAEELAVNCAEMKKKLEGPVGKDPRDVADLIRLNNEFHALIRESSGNVLAVRLLNSLQMPIAYRFYYWQEKSRQKALLDFHIHVVAAFRAGQASKVRQLVERHLLESRDIVLSVYEKVLKK